MQLSFSAALDFYYIAIHLTIPNSLHQPNFSTLTCLPPLGRRTGLGLTRTTSSVPTAAKRNLLRISIRIILNSSADHTLPRHCLGPWENASKAYGSTGLCVHLLGL